MAAASRRTAVRGGWRRRGAAAAGLVLAAALGVAGVAGCSGSSGGSSGRADNAAKAQAPEQPGNGPVSPFGATQDRSGTGTPGSTGSTGGTGDGGSTPGSTPPAATYLVRTANMTVRTPHVERQLDAARDLATAAGGFTGDENTSVDAQGHVQSTIQLRVPPSAYDGVLTKLAALGTLVSRQVSVQDVTGQVVDVASRIASQKASVARVRALMDRASSISDVVALEGELTTRESALESLEAQQASLRSRTDLATISLHLIEPPVKAAAKPKPGHEGFWTAVGHGLRDGWHALTTALRVLLVVLAVLLPFALLGLIGWSVYRGVRRVLPTGRHIALPRRVLPSRGVGDADAGGEDGDA